VFPTGGQIRPANQQLSRADVALEYQRQFAARVPIVNDLDERLEFRGQAGAVERAGTLWREVMAGSVQLY
jgi:hypothetical protein